MSDAISSRKLERGWGGGGAILEEPILFDCMDINVLSPAHECKMNGSLIHLLIVKYLSLRLCLISASVYQTGRPGHGILMVFVCTFRGVSGP